MIFLAHLLIADFVQDRLALRLRHQDVTSSEESGG
jgi:hypothetical protein